MSSNSTSAERTLVVDCGVPIDMHYYLTICDCFPFFTKAEIVMHYNTQKIRLSCPTNALPKSFDKLPTTIVPGGYDSGAWIYLSIGNFKGIRHLTITRDDRDVNRLPDTKRLPDDIWELDQLTYLKSCHGLAQVPQEIWKLNKLKHLDLRFGWGISSLPPSIGKLQHLEFLDLSCTRILRSLPEEIGNLGSLVKLRITESPISSLPSSIDRLQHLKILDLSLTRNLRSLPEEIGNLSSLVELHLMRSPITSLPPSIGKLSKLELLDLDSTENLRKLPTEIGNLVSLKHLRLTFSAISSLPDSLKNMQHPIRLSLEACKLPGFRTVRFYKDIPSIISLDRIYRFSDPTRLGVYRILALNRARFIAKFGIERPRLWPLLLSNACRALSWDQCWGRFVTTDRDYTDVRARIIDETAPADAIYMCLVHGMGSFAQIPASHIKRTEAQM